MPSRENWRCDRCGVEVAPADWSYDVCPRCLVAEEYSERPTEPVTSTLSYAEDDPTSPVQIGPYKILRRLGEGGMGVVFLAEQEEPIRRQVALKLIKLGMDSKQVLARFEAERQALALMNHPSIAHVHDAGVTDQGRPFFAMEYVEGEPITAYCDRHRMTTDERLRLFMQICDGVQHAHQKGIIHRDLKPANVLVTIQDDHPVPKIIDFGVAKATEQRLTEQTMFTQQGMMIGTPEYMSPEQAGLTGFDVDTRTDVYSLGVLLYELLIGALPFDSRELRRAGYDEIRRIIREETPHKPSTRLSTLGEQSEEVARQRGADRRTLAHECSGDLDWITMKALEKDRERRYATPLAFADDVRRHMSHEPVQASPPSSAYRVRKFVKRHRLGVAAGVLVAVALIAGTVIASIGMVQSARSEKRAQEEAVRANRESETANRVSDFLVELLEESDPYQARGEEITVREVLDRAAGRLQAELAEEPIVRARLLSTVGTTYLRMGLLDEAGPPLEEALAIQLELLGEENLDTADTLVGLGRLYDIRRDFEKELEYFRRALAVRENLLGPDHIEIAQILNWMAAEVPGKHLEIRERALAILEKNFGREHPGTFSARSDLALSLVSLGKTEEAREMHELNIAIADAQGLADDPGLALSLHSLAVMYLDEGDFAEALRLAERARAIAKVVYKDEHPYFSTATLGLLAHIHRQAGEPEKARPLLELALEITERGYGPDHSAVVGRRWGLGVLYVELGEREKAEPLLRQTLEHWSKTDGEGTSGYAYNHACFHALLDDREQALRWLRQASDLGYSNAAQIASDTDLASLHGDPEFEAIVAEIGMR